MSSSSSDTEPASKEPSAQDEADRLGAAFTQALIGTMNRGLRTPLNGILGTSKLLLEGDLPAAQRRHAEIIHSSTESLLGLVDELLDLSRIEAGQLLLDAEDFLLRELVQESVELLRHRARAKRIDLRFTVADGTPNALRGDSRRLRRVLLVLAGNAVQLTRRGFVLVSVSAETAVPPSGGVAARVRFAVSDTGIGIAPERLPRIFEPFNRDEKSPGGNGLGLAISKRVVDLMGGEIAVESVLGQGTTFSFTVPLAPARDPHTLLVLPRAGKAAVTDQRRGSFRILIAEDDEINRLMALQVLADAGYEADAVDNGIEALEALEKRSYSLILMDCQMPELDGYEAARLIRELEKGRTDARPVPIVAVTARTLKSDRDACAQAGMDDFVAKPYRAADLIRAVDRNLGLEAPAAAASPEVSAGAEPSFGNGALDAEALQQLRELGQTTQEDLLATLVEIFVRERSQRLTALRQALEAGESKRLGELAHKLISVSGSVGAYRLAKVAGEIEIRARAADLAACRELLEELAKEYEDAESALREVMRSEPRSP